MSTAHQLRNDFPPRAVAAPPVTSPAAALWLDGSSTAITQLRGQIRRVAPYFRTALLTGEPDCGERAAALWLHQLSPLSQRAFVDLSAVNVATLFADPQSEGVLGSVGMFFISRPEELSYSVQTTLLRLLRRYGANAPRIVAVVARSLRPLVTSLGFSADLADHLGALRLALPPLRERQDDIPQLLAHILRNIAVQSGARVPELAPDLMEAAGQLPWRGNLTQLASAAEGLMERATHHILHAPDLDAVLGNLSTSGSQSHREVRMVRLEEIIQEHIRGVLCACNGNKLRTAEVLGISRSTLYRMLDTPLRTSATSERAALQLSC